MKKTLALILSVSLLLTLSACGKKDEPSAPEPTAAPAQTASEYSAPMKSQSETKIYSDGRGEIIECGAEEGDFVEAGTLLYRLDDNGLYDSIATTKNSIEKANITIGTASENESNLSIYAPASGVIKGLTVKEGERVNTGTIAKIVNENEFVARVPFNSSQLQSIKVGASGEIVSDELMSGIPARVTRIYSERNTSVAGAVLYDVELRGENPGTINEGMSVSAVINGISSPAAGYIDESDGESVVSRASGNAGAIRVKDGQYVKKGTLIMTVENSNVTATAQRARIDKEDLEIKLRSLEEDAEDLTIYAPVSGVVIEKNKDVRDSIASRSDSIMTIADNSVLKMEINTGSAPMPEVGRAVTVSYSGGTADGTVTSAESGEVTIEIQNTANIAPNTIGTVKF